MSRLWAAFALVVLLSGATVPLVGAQDATPQAAPPRAPGVPRIAVLDTGINASHPEFAPGQILAWRDFTAGASPVPIDLHGHGTFTASLVAGRNAQHCGTGIDARKYSFAPGAELVIARVGQQSSIDGDVNAAIRWAVSMDVDVISMSFGVIIPTGGGISSVIREARTAGVLVVVSAGNGLLNAGAAPYPSWSGTYGSEPNALVVGGSGRTSALTSTTGNSDPEIVSFSDGVCGALATGGYARWSGTSFSAPLVSGMAAKAMTLARDAGMPSTPAAIERLLHLSATNNALVPYHREGLGFLLTAEWQDIKAHAAAGTLPAYTAQGPHAAADLVLHDELMRRIREKGL